MAAYAGAPNPLTYGTPLIPVVHTSSYANANTISSNSRLSILAITYYMSVCEI